MRTGKYGFETTVSSMKLGFCSFFGVDGEWFPDVLEISLSKYI